MQLSHQFTWLYERLARQRTVVFCTWNVPLALHTCVVAWRTRFLLCCAAQCPLLALAAVPVVSGLRACYRLVLRHAGGPSVKASPGLRSRFNTECCHILSHSEISKIPPYGKTIFSCCRGSKILSWKRKRKEGRKSWYRKQPLIWVLLWKCFALEAPTLLSICLSSHGNHSNKQQCISLEVFKEMNLVFLKYAPFSAYKGIEVERKNVGIWVV